MSEQNRHAIELTEATFGQEIGSSSQPILVDFYAPWCGPCKSMSPVVDALGEELAGKAKVFKLDIEAHTGPAQTYRINSIPSFLIFADGKVVDSARGVVSKQALKNKITAHL